MNLLIYSWTLKSDFSSSRQLLVYTYVNWRVVGEELIPKKEASTIFDLLVSENSAKNKLLITDSYTGERNQVVNFTCDLTNIFYGNKFVQQNHCTY